MLADTPDKSSFSQHGNVMAVLVGMIAPENAQDFILRIATDRTIPQCTFYYQYYLLRAMKASWTRGSLHRHAGAMARHVAPRTDDVLRESRTNPLRLPCVERQPELRTAGHGLRHRTGRTRIQILGHSPESRPARMGQMQHAAPAGLHPARFEAAIIGRDYRTHRIAGGTRWHVPLGRSTI